MKQPDQFEMDYETGECVESTSQKLAIVAEKMRAIHNPYTGNKRKLVVDIFTLIEKHGYKFDSILDLFCGSATVSIAAKYIGKRVVSNDLMMFAYYHAIAFVKNNDIWLTEEEMVSLRDDTPKMMGDLVRRCYSKRFSPKEAEMLDRYRANIYGRYGYATEHERFALAILQLLHYVMDRCFLGGRLNNGQVLADLQHRIDHSRNRGNEKEMNFKMVPRYNFHLDVPTRRHLCFNQDAIELLRSGEAGEVDLCYIDPPYGSDQSDYASMYEFFEQYIRGESDFKGNDKRFVATSEYFTHFLELLDAASKIPVLVFSYNNSSWSKVDDIVGMIRRFRKKVLVEKVEYPYKYREQREPAEEYIIISE